MKSLEQVIKQKCKFLGNSKKPYQLYNLSRPSFLNSDARLFLTNMTIETDNIITLLEEMTPLLVYIFSCIHYGSREGGRVSLALREIHFKLKFPDATLILGESFKPDIRRYEASPSIIRDSIAEIEAGGYCMSFFATFCLQIILKREEILERINENFFIASNVLPHLLYNSEDEDVAITINEIKTYKMEECVTCLENKNNDLFCNCGHICVCEKCIGMKRLTKCPVCKTENTILRIIE